MADRDLEFEAIVLAWRDGALGDDEFAALQEHLLADPEARDAFAAALYRHRQIQRVTLGDDAPAIPDADAVTPPSKTYPIYRKG